MDVDRLVFDFALAMLVLLLAPLLSTRLRLPDIAGLILAGVLVGEHGLGLFRLDVVFQLLGKVGLLYLMFLAGLEINLGDFRRHRDPSLVFGALTFLIPQTLGMLGARLLLGYSWPRAILLASMFASHTLVPFSIVQRFGLGRNRAVAATIGGTILTDTAALLVLAVIVRGAGGDGVGAAFWLRLALSLAALVFGALVLLPRLGYWFFRRAAPDGAAEFVFILAATFLFAYAAELAGLEPILGAFLAGLALSPIVPDRGALMSRLQFVGYAIFIPFFLLSVGMRVNLRALFAGFDGWIVALFMLGAVVAAKWLAARAAGRLLGYSRDETGLVFGLSVNQAAATLAAVLVGVQAGIFDDTILNGAILMILATCLLGPWVVERGARNLAAREDLRPATPRRETGRVLVPLASPLRVGPIMDLAVLLRPDRCHEPVYPLHVSSAGPDDPERVVEAEHLLDGAVARAAAADVPAIPLVRLDSNVAGGILRAAAEFRAGVVLLGWHARKRTLSILQSIPDHVVTHGSQTIVIYHPGRPLPTAQRLWALAPPLIEHHPGLPDLLRLAQRIAARSGARLLLAAPPATRAAIAAMSEFRAGAEPDEWSETPDWPAVLRHFEAARKPGDAILLLNVRRGNLAWQPRLERLPVEWANRWPDANLLVLYPPLGPADAEPAPRAAPSEPPPAKSAPPEPQAIQVQAAHLPDALRELLFAAMPADAGHRQEIFNELMRTGPTPLGDRIVLLHLVTPHVAAARVVVGCRPGGIQVEGMETRPVELAVLLSPRTHGPEDHLHTLAAVARAAGRGTLVVSNLPPP